MDVNKMTPFGLFGTYTHVGIAVKDLDAYLERLRTLFGFEPSSFGETPDDPSRTYYGEKEAFKCRMAFIPLEHTMLEILMPLQGRSVWQDHLDQKGEGVHHINFDVTQYDEAVEHLVKQGLEIVQSGTSFRRPGCRWCYMDAREQLGMYLEIAEVPGEMEVVAT